MLASCAGENDTMLLHRRKEFDPSAIAEICGAHLGESHLRDEDVILDSIEAAAAVGMAALEDEFPGRGRGKSRTALLRDKAMRARELRGVERVCDEALSFMWKVGRGERCLRMRTLLR